MKRLQVCFEVGVRANGQQEQSKGKRYLARLFSQPNGMRKQAGRRGATTTG